MNYEAHGNTNFSIRNSCVINRPNSPFNAEGVYIVFESILHQVESNNIKEWVLIEVMGKEALPTPDAMEVLVNSYTKAVALGCLKIGAVCSNGIQKDLLTQAANKAKIAILFYSNEELALLDRNDFLS